MSYFSLLKIAVMFLKLVKYSNSTEAMRIEEFRTHNMRAYEAETNQPSPKHGCCVRAHDAVTR